MLTIFVYVYWGWWSKYECHIKSNNNCKKLETARCIWGHVEDIFVQINLEKASKLSFSLKVYRLVWSFSLVSLILFSKLFVILSDFCLFFISTSSSMSALIDTFREARNVVYYFKGWKKIFFNGVLSQNYCDAITIFNLFHLHKPIGYKCLCA